jgi:hypothetical protein
MAGILNKVAAGDAGRQLPGVGAYLLLRGMQAHGRDIDRLNAKFECLLNTGRLGDGGETLDRRYPADAKAAPENVDRMDRRQLAAAELRRRYW